MGQPADLVFRNGKIVTIDDDLTRVEAIAVSGNKIVFVGSNLESDKWIGPKTEVIDLQGKLLLPGFNDAHCHLLNGGFLLLRVNLIGAKTLKEIQDKVGKAVKMAPKGTWVQGRGWDHTLFNNGEWPIKEMLDGIATNTPVYLRRIDGHASWVNSAALRLAKITKDTPDTAGGEIVRDKFGNPTGIILEFVLDAYLVLPFGDVPNDSELWWLVTVCLVGKDTWKALELANGRGIELREALCDIVVCVLTDASRRFDEVGFSFPSGVISGDKQVVHSAPLRSFAMAVANAT